MYSHLKVMNSQRKRSMNSYSGTEIPSRTREEDHGFHGYVEQQLEWIN